MKTIEKLLCILFLPVVIAGCGTTKGYTGEKIANDDLAIIYGSSNEIKVGKRKYKEQALIAKIDSLEVGNYFKGWPDNVKVKPGEHIVEIRHIKPWESSNAYMVGGVLGGAIGGAIAGSANEKNSTHYHYLIKFNAEKNQSYRIDIRSNPDNVDAPPMVRVVNTGVNRIVPSVSEEKIINKK